jgi:hypothetical protein
LDDRIMFLEESAKLLELAKAPAENGCDPPADTDTEE